MVLYSIINFGNYSENKEIPFIGHGKEEVLEAKEVQMFTDALDRNSAGSRLNTLEGEKMQRLFRGAPQSPTVINAPTTVNNDTIIPPRITSPHARDAFGERKDFVSKIA